MQSTPETILSQGITLEALGIVDAPPEEAFDRFTHIAKQLLSTPMALISIVQPERQRQFFKSCIGLDAEWMERRETPLSNSFCQHVVSNDSPLVISDSRSHPLALENPAIKAMNWIGYLGVPIQGPDDTTIGALCVATHDARDWTEQEIDLMTRLGGCVSDQIRLKASLWKTEQALGLARAAANSRATFLACMSHEIRTPLNGIIGANSLLTDRLDQRHALTGEGRDELQIARSIDASADLLMRLLNDILDLAKIDSGKIDLMAVPFSPGAKTRHVEKLFAGRAEAKGLDFRIEIASNAEGNAGNDTRLGDAHRFEQILGNLVSNAIKFTREGAVAVRLDLTGARQIELTVSDTGLGMSEAELRDLFEPYVQFGSPLANPMKGSGLGMAITGKIVDAMGGTISVASEAGKGTTVTVSLPLIRAGAAAEAEAEPAAEPVSPAPALPLARKKVLIADDTTTNLTLLETMLRLAGAEVVATTDGEAAVRAARSGDFDLMMLDILMPGMNGIDALSQIREDAAALPGPAVPAIAVTANAFPEQVREYLARGFDAHLAKPFRKEDLLRSVTSVFSERA